MTFIADNQFLLLILFFLVGCAGTAFLFCKPKGHRVWLMADLIWVVLGGIGALVAVLAGIYKADSGRIDRQIDIAYAATNAFDRDAARFRLRYCETADGPAVYVLCDKVDFLSASTAENADLPLFIAVTDEVAPLRGLHFFGGDEDDMTGMMEQADRFDAAQFLTFTTQDDSIRSALGDLRQSDPTIAADYQILAQSYDDLIEQVGTLQDEWAYLQENAHILLLQIIALCLVSFAAPFRLGKSIVDLRR